MDLDFIILESVTNASREMLIEIIQTADQCLDELYNNSKDEAYRSFLSSKAYKVDNAYRNAKVVFRNTMHSLYSIRSFSRQTFMSHYKQISAAYKKFKADLKEIDNNINNNTNNNTNNAGSFWNNFS